MSLLHRQPVLHLEPVACVRMLLLLRHGVPGGRVRPHRAGAERARCRLPSGRGRPRRPRSERAARARHGPRAGVRRDLRRARLLVGDAADVGGDAARAAGRQPAPAAAGPGAGARPGRRQAAAAGAVLGLRGVRRPLRHLRDPERQLVAAGHDERARRLDHRGVAGADGVLGDGDRGARRSSPRSQRRCRRG